MIWHTYRYKALAGLILAPLMGLAPASASPGGAEHGHGMSEGEPGAPAQVTRTIELIARDIEFSRTEIDVKPGETVRFVIRNEGEMDHDFTIGDAEAQAAHREEMRMMMSGEMQDHSHAGSNAVKIEPGETAELIWTFGGDDKVQFGCNVPGHFEAGMHGRFNLNG